jgi:PBP1b-binding outer membrane lipoprotein LpoB
MKRLILGIILILSLCLTGCAMPSQQQITEPEIVEPSEPVEPETPEVPETPEEPEVQKDYATILLYMCGSNLESEYANNSTYGNIGLATMDIMEILSVENQPDDINIVVETGGASKWTKRSYANYGSEDISSSSLQR